MPFGAGPGAPLTWTGRANGSALELGLASARFGKRRAKLDTQDESRRIKSSSPTRLARRMVPQALLKILGRTDVERAGTEAKKVNDARALRRGPLALAQGHSPRFGDQRIHEIWICRLQAMSKPCSDGASNGCPWWTALRTFWSESGCFPRHFPQGLTSLVKTLERMRRLSGHIGAANSLHSLQKSSP